MNNSRAVRRATATVMFLATTLASNAVAQVPAAGVGRFDVPPTVSPEAAEELNKLYAKLAHAPRRERPKNQDDWDRANARLAAVATPISTATADALHVTRSEDRLGGVPVLRIRPANYKPAKSLILYLHGGAYTFLSAASSLSIPALMSTASGREVISIDYALAPRADWHVVTDQVVAVWKAVLASGVKAESVGIMGDSAGGGLAAGAVLKMRDLHLPLPGALYLISPGTDISGAGDTYTTLAAVDPILSTETTAWSAEAYAAVADQKNPYVSPVYGDYSKAFPPTLLQVGTREHLLSSSVREYQAIRSGGHEAVLDVYEGMPHVWVSLIPQAPETKTAIKRGADFFALHLGKARK